MKQAQEAEDGLVSLSGHYACDGHRQGGDLVCCLPTLLEHKRLKSCSFFSSDHHSTCGLVLTVFITPIHNFNDQSKKFFSIEGQYIEFLYKE